MTKTGIGLGLVVIGLAYGSLAVDRVNAATVGYLTARGWLKMPQGSSRPRLFGPKLSIFSIGGGLVLIGFYLIIKQ